MSKRTKTKAQKRQAKTNSEQSSQNMPEVEIVAESSSSTQARARDRVARRDGWRDMFLDTFRNSGNVRAACMYADVARQTVEALYKKDAEFAAAYDEAEEEAVDLLVAEAWNRARNGSDRLLEFMLKGHRPSRYADRPVETKVQVNVDIDGQKPTDAILGRIEQMSERLPSRDLPQIEE